VGAAAADRNGYPVAAIGLTFLGDGVADPDTLGRATVQAADALTSRLAGRA
jgi:hypothetical protein